MEGLVKNPIEETSTTNLLDVKQSPSDWFEMPDHLKRWESTINYYMDSSMTLSDLSQSPSMTDERNRSEMYMQKDRITSESTLEVDFDTNFPWDELEIPGSWGQHGIEKYPWSDYDRPFVQINKYADLDFTEEELEGLLTERMIGACCSYLERSPQIGHYALAKCQLQKKSLKDIWALRHYHYIQYLDLSNNRISDITCLGQMPFLMYLDASCNELTSVLNFKPPFNLTYVNFSHNLVDNIGDLSAFWSIVYLDLSYNLIFEIKGLSELKYLRHLNLSYNEIERLENLDNLPLQTLHLQHNLISKFAEDDYCGFKTNNYLIFVDLNCNKLKSLRLFRDAHALEEIDLSGNVIDSLYELNYLKDLTRMVKVDFSDNPISHLDDYYNACLFLIRTLCVLDNNLIDPAEKVQARAKFDEFPTLMEARRNMRLTMLMAMNTPYLEAAVVPVDQPPPPVIILVGLPASKKGHLVREFCAKYPKYARLGVSYTTRNKWQEVDGEAYYFVDREKFMSMTKRGEFLAVSEFLGNSYGFAQTELSKVTEERGVLVFHTDINSALILRRKGLRPRMVLALPSTPHVHEEYLKEKYTYSSYQPLQALGGLLIENNPHREQQMEMIDNLQRQQDEQVVRGIVHEIVERSMPGGHRREVVVEPEESDVMQSSSDDITTLMAPRGFPIDRNQSILKTRSKSAMRMQSFAAKPSIADFYNIQSVRSVTFKMDPDWDVMTSSDDQVMISSISETLVGSPSATIGQLSVLSSAAIASRSLSGAQMTAAKEDGDEEEEDPLPRSSSSSKLRDKNQLADILYNDILASREVYLEVHRNNPGLFCELIHTDRVEDSIKKLKTVLKECVERQKTADTVHTYKKDAVYDNMMFVRLQQLHSDMRRVLGSEWKQTECELHKQKTHQEVPEYITKIEDIRRRSREYSGEFLLPAKDESGESICYIK